MNNLAWAIQSVQNAPRGSQVGAFFDLDGTLVEGFTALKFLRDHIQRGEISASALVTLVKNAAAFQMDPGSGVDLIRASATLLAGRALTDLEERAARVFRKQIARSIRPEARRLVRAHQEAGHTVVLATAATQFQAGPVADDLGIAHVLSTEVQVEDGILTGELNGSPRWGSEKARAVTEFSAQRGLDVRASFGYGNGAEDIDFLQAVGRPVAVTPDRGLQAKLKGLSIPTLKLEEPPRPGVRGLVGTFAAFGTFNAGIALTLAGASLFDRKQALGYGLGKTADITLATAGIAVNAENVEHIEAARPAVYIFNHQSNLDPAVVGSLIRHDVTGVGKAELRSDPRGIALRLLDIAMIDRSNSEQARKSVGALVDRIRGGESVLIAPEGTRMPTPKLGPFKMGAFHLAMDARVPVVPIVIRNSGEHWPKGAALIRPGTVDVRVLPPVPTDDWTAENLKARVQAIRRRFEETLSNWATINP